VAGLLPNWFNLYFKVKKNHFSEKGRFFWFDMVQRELYIASFREQNLHLHYPKVPRFVMPESAEGGIWGLCRGDIYSFH
jgi:hypothetical protein